VLVVGCLAVVLCVVSRPRPASAAPPTIAMAAPPAASKPIAPPAEAPKPPPVAPPAPPAPVVRPQQPESRTELCGTAIEFYGSPAEAAQVARQKSRLQFIVHVSGYFEDSKFT
jgi:hypothetical protein